MTAGVVTGIETGNFDEAMKAAAIAGSDGFKWGAFSGVIAGGATETVKYANAMKAQGCAIKRPYYAASRCNPDGNRLPC